MAVRATTAAILIAYVLSMGFLFWFCVIADPAKSPTVRFVTYTIPTKLYQVIERGCGPRAVQIVEVLADRFLALIYLTVVLGCYSVMWWFVYPWIDESDHVANYHKLSGYVVIFSALYSWRLVHITSPGIINADTLRFYDHFPYDDLLYVEGRNDSRRGLPRLARSKFDRLKYDAHVGRFDHYCGWVHNTIGEENYRWFVMFVFIQLVMCAYGGTVLFILFRGEIRDKQLYDVVFFDRVTGLEYKATTWIVLQYLFHQRTFESCLLVVMVVMGIALTGFLGYHVYITSLGMTTNEHFKWGQVKKWHEKEAKKCQAFLEQQQNDNNLQSTANSTTSSNEKQNNQHQRPVVVDGDVACSGGKVNAFENDPDAKTSAEENEVIEDPGLMPTNIYNRGLIENWKEVFFPMSLQRKAAAGYSRLTCPAVPSEPAKDKPKAT